nr:RcpC/CpaB family pilus assembly protein [Patulibacter sp. SYSU D01012]
MRAAVGPSVPVVVAGRDLPAGRQVDVAALAVRRVPARYAPADRIASPDEVAGLRPRVAVPAGRDVTLPVLDTGGGPQLRPGERVADLVATGDPKLVQPGTRVDLLVTRDGGGEGGATRLALEDAEVLRAESAPDDPTGETQGRRVAVGLRVTVKQAVYLAAAQNFASELRILPRGPGDERRGADGTVARSTLEGLG